MRHANRETTTELTPSQTVLDIIEDAFGASATVRIDYEEHDPGMSYEDSRDTLYLYVEVPSHRAVELREVIEFAEFIEVDPSQVYIDNNSGMTRFVFAQHLDDVKWWLRDHPLTSKHDCLWPGMEFEVPSNFDAGPF